MKLQSFLIAGAAALWSMTALAAPTVSMKTTQGEIVIELYPEKAPKSVENFLAYAKSGFYNGTVFHRVIDGFMIQGGGFTADMEKKPTRGEIPIESKNGLKNERGSLAMARTSNPNSATSQFFINVVDNPKLDYPSFDGHGYTVFGKVIRGLDVVDKIKQVPTTTKAGHENVPATAVLIEKTTILQEK